MFAQLKNRTRAQTKKGSLGLRCVTAPLEEERKALSSLSICFEDDNVAKRFDFRLSSEWNSDYDAHKLEERISAAVSGAIVHLAEIAKFMKESAEPLQIRNLNAD